jgi:hypothetical protein
MNIGWHEACSLCERERRRDLNKLCWLRVVCILGCGGVPAEESFHREGLNEPGYVYFEAIDLPSCPGESGWQTCAYAVKVTLYGQGQVVTQQEATVVEIGSTFGLIRIPVNAAPDSIEFELYRENRGLGPRDRTFILRLAKSITPPIDPNATGTVRAFVWRVQQGEIGDLPRERAPLAAPRKRRGVLDIQ